ncbi:hypothetical protein BaRGS_00012729, partial [Batillaria attramentaria]
MAVKLAKDYELQYFQASCDSVEPFQSQNVVTRKVAAWKRERARFPVGFCLRPAGLIYFAASLPSGPLTSKTAISGHKRKEPA